MNSINCEPYRQPYPGVLEICIQLFMVWGRCFVATLQTVRRKISTHVDRGVGRGGGGGS